MDALVTGATGFVGARVVAALAARGDGVRVVSRDPAAARARLPGATAHGWDLRGPPPAAALAGAAAVVNLAGEPVVGRWTAAKRRAIEDSRVLGTRALVDGLAALPAADRPRRLVSASAIGYYGDRGEAALDEEAAPGDDFLAAVCRRWEDEARRAEDLGVAVTRLRIGLVLAPGGGALGAMLGPARLGLSGPLGPGRQWWAWIHRDDLVALALWAVDGRLDGAVNATAPEPVRQADFARALGRALGRPAFLPAPALALRLALGEFSVELLASRRVLPRRAQAAGFAFRFPTLDGALTDLLGPGRAVPA